MKSITALLALTLLHAVASNRCLAEMGIVEVSRERAKELGMEMVQSTPASSKEFYEQQMAMWAPIVKASGAKVE